jgi:hypothetical protein
MNKRNGKTKPLVEMERPDTRAVRRRIEQGINEYCDAGEICGINGGVIKFAARAATKDYVVCNVYEDGQWNRVEHYHLHCYENAGQPYGKVLDSLPVYTAVKAVVITEP